MIAAFLFISCEGQFSLKQTLWPPSADDTGLFGRSVSFSAQRIVVGASMFQSPGRIQHNGNQTGAVYPYTYDAEKDCFFPSPGTSASPFRIDPSKSPDIVPGTFGSKVQISLDGTALIVGAPYTDVSTTYRDFVINDTDFDPSTDIVNYTDPEGISQSFYSEIGAIYLFMLQNDGSWIQDRVSVPATIVYRGGYGRSLAGNDNLRTFAGAYFNKIRPGSSIPQKVGKVFVESRTDFGLRQYPVIDPPPPITNKSTQRFGSVLSLFDDKTLFVVSQAIAGSVSAVYIYERSNDLWVMTGNVTAKQSFDNFGQSAAVRGKSLIAVYGSDAATSRSQIVILRADASGNWNPSPTQIIGLGTKQVGDTGIFFCQHSDLNFLAAVISEPPSVLVYQENEATEQFELFQIIDDPEVVQSEVTVPYEEQHVHFGSDFAWEVNQCTRFVVGAMAKMDGADGLPTPFGRAYVFTLTETNQSLGAVSIVFIVVGVLVGLAAVTGFVIWLRKRWRKRYDDANAKLLSVMENVTKV